MVDVIGKVVEKDIAESAAKNDTERAIEDEVGDFLRPPSGARTFRAIHTQPPGAKETDEVHQPIPVNLERTQVNGDGINIGCEHGAALCDRCRHVASIETFE